MSPIDIPSIESDETKKRRVLFSLKLNSGLLMTIWRQYEIGRMRPVLEVWKFHSLCGWKNLAKKWSDYFLRLFKKRQSFWFLSNLKEVSSHQAGLKLAFR